MAVADRTLMLKLIADVGQPTKELKGVTGALKKSGTAALRWGKAFTGALVIGGIEKLVGSIDDALEGFREGEQAARTLGQTWRTLGRDTDQLAGVLDTLGDKALDLGFDDAEVITAFNTFLAKSGSVKESTAGVTAAMNLARAKGITFARAVKIVTGQLGDLDPALRRNRRQARRWAEHHPIEVAAGKISDAWEEVVGFFSQGKIDRALASVGKIGEQLGVILFGGEVAPGIETEGLIAKFAGVGGKIVDKILEGLTELGGRIQTAWDEQIATVDWGKAIPDALGSFWNDTLQPFLTGLADKGPIAAGAITAIAVALAALAAPAIAASLPLLAIGLAVAGVTAAIVVLIENLPKIQAELQKVQTAIQPILDKISQAFDTTIGHIANLLGTIRNAVQFVIDKLNELANALNGNGAKGTPFDFGDNPFPGEKFAKGGIVTRPTIGLLGEAGPEAVVPLDRAGGLGGITINITAGVGNPVEIGREVDRVLRAYRGRAGVPA